MRVRAYRRVWQARYALTPRHSGVLGISRERVRTGALLKFEFDQVGFGYADCHPWLELGDAPLALQLAGLKERILTPLTQRSLQCAFEDAVARAEGRSLFAGHSIPPSHYLVTDLAVLRTELKHAQELGFKTLKLKVGHPLIVKAAQIFECVAELREFQLRLDFNEAVAEEEVRAFLGSISELQARIEFLEDPIPYDPEKWARLREDFGMKLALDRGNSDALDAVDVVVTKPAVEELRGGAMGRKLVVTSYLDHPVGQLFAAVCAARAATAYPGEVLTCGVASHLAYQPIQYQITVRGDRLDLPMEPGLGFEAELKREGWVEV